MKHIISIILFLFTALTLAAPKPVPQIPVPKGNYQILPGRAKFYMFTSIPRDLKGGNSSATSIGVSTFVGSSVPADFMRTLRDTRGPNWAARHFMHFKKEMGAKKWDVKDIGWLGYFNGYDTGDTGYIGISMAFATTSGPGKDHEAFLKDVRAYFEPYADLEEQNGENASKMAALKLGDLSRLEVSGSAGTDTTTDHGAANSGGMTGGTLRARQNTQESPDSQQKANPAGGCVVPEDKRETFANVVSPITKFFTSFHCPKTLT